MFLINNITISVCPEKVVLLIQFFLPPPKWAEGGGGSDLQLISYKMYLECTLIQWRLQYISIPECTGSSGYLFHEIPGTLDSIVPYSS